jgi:SSS family solute:Na+ symporter
MRSAVILGVAAAYLAVCLAVGSWPGRRASKTAAGYVAGDRALGLVVLYFITGATIFSAFAFLGLPGWAYSRGVAACYILAYGAVGFVPFYFVGPRAARLGRVYGYVTQAELVAGRTASRSLALLMAAVSLVAFLPYLALQMRGAGYVLEAMTAGALPAWAGTGLVYVVVLAYVLRSGVLGVGWTNTLQGLFMMVLAWSLGLYLPARLYGGIDEMFARIAAMRPELLAPPGLAAGGEPWTWGGYASAVLVSAIGFSFWPHLFMKAFTARDDATIRRTVVLYPTFQLFLVPLLLIGFAGVLFAPAPGEPDQVLPHMLVTMDLPPLLVGLFCAGALAASMSSGDAMMHAAAAIAVRDGWICGLARPLPPEAERAAIRVVVVVFALAAYAVAVLHEGSLVGLLLLAFGPVTQLVPVVVSVLYARRASPPALIAGLLVGSGVNALLVAWPALQPFPLHAGLWGLVANVATIAVVSALARPRSVDEHDRHFLAVAAGERSDR